MLKVHPVQGEATRFYVESNTLECLNRECGKIKAYVFHPRLFNRKEHPELQVGGRCPVCKTGQLDVRFHQVDVSEYNCNGSCTCEHFVLNPKMEKKIKTLSPAEQAMGMCRCHHINEARDFALDLSIKGHQRFHKHDQEAA